MPRQSEVSSTVSSRVSLSQLFQALDHELGLTEEQAARMHPFVGELPCERISLFRRERLARREVDARTPPVRPVERAHYEVAREPLRFTPGTRDRRCPA